MPKAKSKPVQPVTPTPPPVPEPLPATPPSLNLPVIYDHLEMDEYSTASAKGPLDFEWCKDAMGWETEKEFKIRMVAEKGGKPEHYLFGELGIRCDDGTVIPIHCKNLAGEKVVCKNNAHNRSFDMDWCEAMIHTILYGQWAGPYTIPGETVNGETVRISRYGRVISGQHQMTACILAGEWLAKARAGGTDSPTDPKYPAWVKHSAPFIECVVIKGLSEDPRVLMTVDYVKPRTVADMLYTSTVFAESTPPERKELCRMMSSAADLLWTRTGAKGYRTHPEVAGFLDRHKSLLDCVLHLYTENGAQNKTARKISVLRLQPGNCAALMYLMGCGAVSPEDSDAYRNESPPTEKNLDWSCWDKAEEFWTLLASSNDFVPVRHALGRLVESETTNEDNQGQGGRGPEKLAILAAAWERWKDHTHAGPPFDDDDLAPGGLLCLSYSNLDDKGNKLPNGQIKLLDVADFYGIDCPGVISKGPTSKGPPDPPAPTGEEYERLKEEAQARRQQQAKK